MMSDNTTCQEKNIETSVLNKTDGQAILSIISTPKRTEAMALFALEHGADSALFVNASGTITGNWLNLLGLSNVKRSLAVLRINAEKGVDLLHKIEDHFTLNRSMGGIAWIQNQVTETSALPTEYSMVVAIVNSGEGRLVVDQARRSHPVGASILEAVGSADHTRKTFNFEIVPEKEVVLIISKTDECNAVRDTIYEALRTEKPGRGVLYTTCIDAVSGIYHAKNSDDFKVFEESDDLAGKADVWDKDTMADADAWEKDTLIEEADVLEKDNLADDTDDWKKDTLIDKADVAREELPLTRETTPASASAPASSEMLKPSRYIGLIAVTERGRSADIVACAESAGGRGATILHGRETNTPSGRWLDKLTQSTRDSVIIIAEEKTAETILSALKKGKLAAHLRTFIFDVRDFRLFSYGYSK